jgi:hypothetical protein
MSDWLLSHHHVGDVCIPRHRTLLSSTRDTSPKDPKSFRSIEFSDRQGMFGDEGFGFGGSED